MLNEIYHWYEEQVPGLGERFLDEMDIGLIKLKKAPYSYTLLRGNYRQLLLKNFPYKVVFEIAEMSVIVYAVFHAKRDSEKFFL